MNAFGMANATPFVLVAGGSGGGSPPAPATGEAFVQGDGAVFVQGDDSIFVQGE